MPVMVVKTNVRWCIEQLLLKNRANSAGTRSRFASSGKRTRLYGRFEAMRRRTMVLVLKQTRFARDNRRLSSVRRVDFAIQCFDVQFNGRL
jgi:hypothetical protein